MSNHDYSKMTQDEFDNILREIINEQPASALLAIGDVYSIVAEEYNNDVLDLWAERQEQDPPDPPGYKRITKDEIEHIILVTRCICPYDDCGYEFAELITDDDGDYCCPECYRKVKL